MSHLTPRSVVVVWVFGRVHLPQLLDADRVHCQEVRPDQGIYILDPKVDPAGSFVVKLALSNESFSSRGNIIKAFTKQTLVLEKI